MTLRILTLIGLSIFALSCNGSSEKFDEDAERQALLAVREVQRDAHFNKDAEAFVETFLDEFVSVNRGQIRTPSRDENIQRFQEYFDAVEFVKWDDFAEPVIRFSENGKLAYVITEKQVDLNYPGTEGETYLDQTRYAWMTIFRKTDSGWKVEAIASTNQESINTVTE